MLETVGMREKDRAKHPVPSGLRAARQAKKYTLEKVADFLGISSSHYLKIERGERGIFFRDVVRLAEFLSVPVARLTSPPLSIPLAGILFADGRVKPANGVAREVPVPPFASEETLAYVVEGNAMGPVAPEGSVVYHNAPVMPSEKHANLPCMVFPKGHDFPSQAGRLVRGKNYGAFELHTFNGVPFKGKFERIALIIGVAFPMAEIPPTGG